MKTNADIDEKLKEINKPYEKITFLGYRMTREEKARLQAKLLADIIDQYNKRKYWSKDIIKDFLDKNS